MLRSGEAPNAVQRNPAGNTGFPDSAALHPGYLLLVSQPFAADHFLLYSSLLGRKGASQAIEQTILLRRSRAEALAANQGRERR